MDRISKLDAARRQIDCAIKLLFDGEDDVPVHTLAWAAYCLASDVAKSSPEPISQTRIAYQQFFEPYDRKFANFLKHADNDPRASHYERPCGCADLLIEAAIAAYKQIGGLETPAMTALASVIDLRRGSSMSSEQRDEKRREEERDFDRRREGASSDEEIEEVYKWREREQRFMERAYLSLGRHRLGGTNPFEMTSRNPLQGYDHGFE